MSVATQCTHLAIRKEGKNRKIFAKSRAKSTVAITSSYA
jgi:hypothetical protein